MNPLSLVFNEDCMAMMQRYPDKFFNLAVVDPPYGIGIGKKKTLGKRRKTVSTTVYKQSNWDAEIPSKEYFIELFRVSENQIIFGANYFSHLLPSSPGWFVWNKNQPQEFSMSHAELAFTSFNRAIRMAGVKRSEYMNCVSNNKALALKNARIHQCQKPIGIYKYLLNTYAKPGDKIIDTHLGSQSSRIAAYKLGFDFWGCEIDTDHFNNGNKRFNEAITNPLFNESAIINSTQQKFF